MLELLITFLYILLAIAFFTIAERKVLASIQRRKGPNVTGFWGTLQAIADGLKLIFKEVVIPVRANWILFIIAVNITLLVWAVVSVSEVSHLTNFSFNRLLNGAGPLIGVSLLCAHHVIFLCFFSKALCSSDLPEAVHTVVVQNNADISIVIKNVFFSEKPSEVAEIKQPKAEESHKKQEESSNINFILIDSSKPEAKKLSDMSLSELAHFYLKSNTDYLSNKPRYDIDELNKLSRLELVRFIIKDTWFKFCVFSFVAALAIFVFTVVGVNIWPV